MKKIVSILLGVVLIFSTFAFVGCNRGKYDDLNLGLPSEAPEPEETKTFEYSSLVSLRVKNPDHKIEYTSVLPTRIEMDTITDSIDYWYTIDPNEEKELVIKVKQCEDSSDFKERGRLYRIVGDNRTSLDYDQDLSEVDRIDATKPGVYTRRLVYPEWGEFTVKIEILEDVSEE